MSRTEEDVTLVLLRDVTYFAFTYYRNEIDTTDDSSEVRLIESKMTIWKLVPGSVTPSALSLAPRFFRRTLDSVEKLTEDTVADLYN